MNIKFYKEKVRKGSQTIKRFHMEHVLKSQNLAEHGYHVANIFAMACDHLGIEYSAKDLLMVMNHDSVESLTGDLNRRIKESSKACSEAWDIIEEEVVVNSEYEVCTDKDIKKALSVDAYGCFLFADAYEAFLYCSEEYRKGNDFLLQAKSYYDAVCRKISMELSLVFELRL